MGNNTILNRDIKYAFSTVPLAVHDASLLFYFLFSYENETHLFRNIKSNQILWFEYFNRLKLKTLCSITRMTYIGNMHSNRYSLIYSSNVQNYKKHTRNRFVGATMAYTYNTYMKFKWCPQNIFEISPSHFFRFLLRAVGSKNWKIYTYF